MDHYERYQAWLTGNEFDDETKSELKSIADDEREIKDRFYKELSFGTGGLRGVVGAGTNRMNFYTVGKANQGLADFINAQTGNNGSVAIAYDSRRMSKEFALSSALILAANGVKAYLFDALRPTPELSFAVRYLGCTAGIVITASHNPPEYNGYKVYWSDGGQIVPPYDEKIINSIKAVKSFSSIKKIDEKTALDSGLLTYIGKEIDDAYIEEVKKNVLNKDLIKNFSKNVKIVYTPLYGTGLMLVKRVLDELGFVNVHIVEEQTAPVYLTSGAVKLNPEDPLAFESAIELAKKVDADIILATDPDADRLGVYAKNTRTGRYDRFNGNMSGLLIAEYEISQKQQKGLLPENSKAGAIVTTIVSSKMAKDIANEYGLTYVETLTGFKYIGEQIKNFEQARKENGGKLNDELGAYEYLFGFEESYGCLVGTHARDKDAIMAVTALCDAVTYYKSQGLTLCDQMVNVYKKYGYYVEDLTSVTLPGADGAEKIAEIIDAFRNRTPSVIGGEKVLALRDYLTGERKVSETEEVEKLTLPKSNVLYFELENNGWCCVRPSGTEPKIKFYFGAKGESDESALYKLELIKRGILKLTK